MKISIGDVLVTNENYSILVVDIKNNTVIRGIYNDEECVRNVGIKSNIIHVIEIGFWKHFPVINDKKKKT